jgi:hypothetical protein
MTKRLPPPRDTLKCINCGTRALTCSYNQGHPFGKGVCCDECHHLCPDPECQAVDVTTRSGKFIPGNHVAGCNWVIHGDAPPHQ